MSTVRRALQLLLRISIPAGILGVGVLALVFSRKTEAETESIPLPPPPLVSVVPVVDHDQPFVIEVDGTVVPYRDIKVPAEVGGLVVKKHEICRAGNYVTQGTPLFELDRRDYQLEVDRLQQQVAQCDADLSELIQEEANVRAMIQLAEEDVRLRTSDLRRMENLFKDEAGSEADVDRAKQTLLTAQIQLQTHNHAKNLTPTKRKRLEAKKAIAESQLELANVNLRRTQVAAPTTGVIVDVMAEQGDYVPKGSTVLQIEDTSRVEVRCNLQMDEVYWLWAQPRGTATKLPNAAGDYQVPPTPATVVYQLADQPDTRYCWKGELTRFDGVGLDERTRTMPCRVVVDDPLGVTVQGESEQPAGELGAGSIRGPRALVRGMFVTIRLQTQATHGILRIPEAALRPGNKLGLAKLEPNGEAVDRASELGQPAGQATYREITVRTIAPFEESANGQTERFWLVEVGDTDALADASIVLKAPRGLSAGSRVLVRPAASPGDPGGAAVQARNATAKSDGSRGEAPTE